MAWRLGRDLLTGVAAQVGDARSGAYLLPARSIRQLGLVDRVDRARRSLLRAAARRRGERAERFDSDRLARMRDGNAFHREVQADWKATAETDQDEVGVEASIVKPSGRAGRMDINLGPESSEDGDFEVPTGTR